MNEKVKNYIDRQPDNIKHLLMEARKLILYTIPDCTESFEWGVLCYSNGKIYLAAMKNRVHIGFSIVGLPESYIKLLDGRGRTARHKKIFTTDELEEKNIAHLVKVVSELSESPD